MSKEYKCVSPVPRDLADGRIVSYGDIATIDEEDPHNKQLIENGDLIEAETEKAEKSSSKKSSAKEEGDDEA
jgi:hypothetical protein